MSEFNNSDQRPAKKRRKVDDDFDRENNISRLPYDVLFDYLSAKDRAIAAAVSKDWNKFLSSYPVFHADYFSFEKKNFYDETSTFPAWETVPEWTRKFLKIMNKSLRKFSKQHAAGRRNSLVVTMRGTGVLEGRNSDYLDRWIKLVVDKSFTDLHLNFRYMGLSSDQRYVLPKVILNARSLVALSIRKCKLPSIGRDVVICLDSLQQLNLVKCFCDQTSIENLISACHSLRELSIIECSDVTELNLHLYKLKKLMVRHNVQLGKSIQKIIVRATCLLSFSYISNTRVDKPCQINLKACKHLESLCIECFVFPKGFSQSIGNNFPLLRSLILSPAQGLGRVSVCSKKLESFSFGHACDKFETLCHHKVHLPELVIRTPNLKFFYYAGRSLKHLSDFSKFSPYRWIKKIKLYTERQQMETKWFLSLGDAISKLGSNLTLSLLVELFVRQDRWSFNIEELGTARFRRLAKVEHLKLKALLMSNDLCLLRNGSLMVGLLWSCHPKTLSLSVPSCSDIGKLRQDLLNLIMEQHTCDPNIFRHRPHHLKDVMVEYVVDSKCKKEVEDSRRKIKFSFKWRGTDKLGYHS